MQFPIETIHALQLLEDRTSRIAVRLPRKPSETAYCAEK